uniref:Uncharacterized protein n=1 Tax=Strongyloides stercoralis TaxID=6248 RepID=A0A0K0ET96_STRER
MQLNNLFFIFLILPVSIYSEEFECYAGIRVGESKDKNPNNAQIDPFKPIKCPTKICTLFKIKKMNKNNDQYEIAGCGTENICNQFKKSKILFPKEAPQDHVQKIYGKPANQLSEADSETRLNIALTCCTEHHCNNAYRKGYFTQFLASTIFFSLIIIQRYII